jgi:hypothetical protein
MPTAIVAMVLPLMRSADYNLGKDNGEVSSLLGFLQEEII